MFNLANSVNFQKRSRRIVPLLSGLFPKDLSGIIILFFLFFITYSFFSFLVNTSSYSARAINLNLTEKVIEPERGKFYDKNGIALTENVDVYDLYLKRINLENKAEDFGLAFDYLSQNNRVEKPDFEKILEGNTDYLIIKNLSKEEAAKIQANVNSTTFYFLPKKQRRYLYPNEFAHIIGYVGQVSQEDVAEGYLPLEYRGKYKLEASLENELKGTRGKLIYFSDVETREESEPGNNIELTIDLNWQRKLYEIMAENSEQHNASGSAGVIIDNSNGNVQAMVSYPGFDSNKFINGISTEEYNAMIGDRKNPLLDKAIGLQASPGSSFKLISAYNLLQNKAITLEDNYFSNRCVDLGGGMNFCEFGKFYYGNMNLTRALYKSSNLFFCNYTLRQSREGGLTKFVEAGHAFNIGKKTGINLPGEIEGNMDSPEYHKNTFNLPWYDGDTCNAVIGQGAVVTTPIQMAMVASTIENNGIYYQPNVINKVIDQFGNTIREEVPTIKKTITIDPEIAATIRDAMHKTAHYWDGTVYYFLKDSPGNVRVKTGTAETYETVNGQAVYRTHGWIVGSFDYQGKSYSFTFHLNNGGGGFYIAKAVKQFMNCLYSNFSGGCQNV